MDQYIQNTDPVCSVPSRTVLPPLSRTPEKQRHLHPPPPPHVLSVEGEGVLDVAPTMRPVSPQTRRTLYQDSSHHVGIVMVHL